MLYLIFFIDDTANDLSKRPRIDATFDLFFIGNITIVLSQKVENISYIYIF